MTHDDVLYLLLLFDLLSPPNWAMLVYFMPRLLLDCWALVRLIGVGGTFMLEGSFFDAVTSYGFYYFWLIVVYSLLTGTFLLPFDY